MTLHLTLVFMLLMTEMGFFFFLVMPMPFAVKRKIFTFISESKIVAQLQHGLKITFIFILILFIDSVNRVWRVQAELALAEKSPEGAAIMPHQRMEVQTRKFYSQRNMYLCGFTLFLSIILNRTYVMSLEVLRLEGKVKEYEGTDKNTKEAEKLAAAGEPGEIGRLRKELEAKDRDLATLKKQCEGLQREYNNVSDQLAATQQRSGDLPKKDM